ncbi:cell wall / vacuolar inhibitor of fructosidase 1-like [Cicer arietinum]|uniref:Cell wall / vacuolar inhibitor of fructosidase 1-like n=1 Tax=Cicer arietinum TaxID=3827 RepID=A0A1S2YQB0_CICAR|nr:cell wall / vacuolar inhibitor of fructosidase 1-like [Cicer arietinum]
MKRIWICIFILILEIVDVSCAVKRDDSLKTRVCEQTSSFDLCISIIDSDPNATTADIKGLALIMVTAVPPYVQNALSLTNSVIKTTTDATLKKKLFVCAKSFVPLLNSVLPQAAQAVNQKRFKNASDSIFYADKVIEDCNSQFFTPTQSPIIEKTSLAHGVLNVAEDILKQILTS